MAWRPHPRRLEIDSSSPRGAGTCDRCEFVTNLYKLSEQQDWRGLQLVGLHNLCCQDCIDDPQRQLGSIILAPDPPGLLNARPEPYPIDEYWPRLLQGGQPRYMQRTAEGGRQVPRVLQYASYFRQGKF
jgi:hypothetical protein